MKITDDKFYELETNSSKFAFNKEEKAVEKIQKLAEEGSPDFEDILLFKVDTSSEKWGIEQIPWSKIAAKLFGGE